MPNGTVHSTTTVLLGLAGAAFMVNNGQPAGPTLTLAAGVLAGLVLTPDLDIDEGCISDRYVRRSVGPIGGGLWALYWMPYSRLIPHRSPLSHLPVLGTAIRLVYAGALPVAIYSVMHGALALPPIPLWVLGWFALGLACADTLHFLLDQIF